jgi:serine/threonine-protein kinase
MQYVPGQSLDEMVRQAGALSAQRVLSVMRQLCSALGAVHSLGIVHRDIKPSNIMAMACQHDCDSAKLIDFGLAQRAGVRGNTTIPASDSFEGSPHYAAPEASAGMADFRSDIYSIGATAYHLLAGRPVFDERQPVAAILAHAKREPISIASLRSDVRGRFDAIIMKCLQKNPNKRFQSVAELDVALQAVSREGSGTHSSPVVQLVNEAVACPASQSTHLDSSQRTLACVFPRHGRPNARPTASTIRL